MPSRHFSLGSLPNAWGFLVNIGDFTTAGHGAVPSRIIEMFMTRKAYIFFLEVDAQIMALTASRPRLDPLWLCFIDNTAGKQLWLKVGAERV